MDYKELAWNCEARAEVFRTLRNEAGAMHEEQCGRSIKDLLARAEAAEAAQDTLQRAMAEYKARAEKAERERDALKADLDYYKHPRQHPIMRFGFSEKEE